MTVDDVPKVVEVKEVFMAVVTVNVWDGDTVIEFDVEKDVIVEDDKLDGDVKSREAEIDGNIYTVDSRVVE